MTIREMMAMYHSLQFVEELLDYIEQYPDDDYMTMECLCRKLVKYKLMKKIDGYYIADRKTGNSSEKPNNCEPKICDTCRYYNSNIPCGSTPSACNEADKFAEEFVDGLKKLKPKTEPKYDAVEFAKDINRRVDIGKKEWNARHIETEPQTEDLQDWKDRMWAEAVIEPQTEVRYSDSTDYQGAVDYVTDTDCSWR